MYIKITKNIVDAAIAGDEIALNLLRDMDFACHHGKHMFLGDYETLVLIKEQFPIRFPSLSKLFAHLSTIGAIVNTLIWHVEFSLDDKESYVKEEEGQYTIVISRNEISHFQAFNECHVLVENLEDIQMYQHILDFYKKDNGISKIRTIYYPILGGGSTTAMVLKQEMETRQSLVLCIVDSDKPFASAQMKETAKKVKEAYDNSKYKYNTKFYILDKVMEVENLIPFCIFEKYCTPSENDGSKKELYEKLKIIKSVRDYDEKYLDFFDFKKGICSSHLVDESLENTNREIIERVSSELQMPILPNSDRYKRLLELLSAPELNLGQQAKEKIINKWCMETESYISGLGKEILSNVLKSCSENLSKVEKGDLSNTQYALYTEIGTLMFNWTCAIKPNE